MQYWFLSDHRALQKSNTKVETRFLHLLKFVVNTLHLFTFDTMLSRYWPQASNKILNMIGHGSKSKILAKVCMLLGGNLYCNYKIEKTSWKHILLSTRNKEIVQNLRNVNVPGCQRLGTTTSISEIIERFKEIGKTFGA